MADRPLTMRQLEAESARVAKKRNRLDRSLTEQLTVETAYRARVETFVLETARATGVTSLPLQKIVESFRDLGGAGKEVGADKESAETVETKKVDAPRRRRGGSKSKVSHDGDVKVSVKTDNRVKGDDRGALEAAKLHWNGKRRAWTGVVDAATVVTLRKRFPDRFAVGWPPPVVVEATPQDTAAVGDPTTTDMPMPAETVPAGGIGRGAPHTPPVGQDDTTIAGPAGGAVAGGAGAASDDTKDNAGDTSEAPAPGQLPVAAKSPAPPPAVRFPNFPRAGARG